MKSKVYQAPSHPIGNFKNYVIGYVSSIVITLIAYFSATRHIFTRNTIIYLISALAIIQFIIQIVYFLHLFHENKPRYRLFVFILMLSIVLIIVIGTIWIMNNLNQNTSLANQIKYMNNQGGGF